MGVYDNRIEGHTALDCCCIICGGSFTVYPRPPYHGDKNVNQTLFCQNCLQTLKDALNREQTKDFGW